MGGAARESETSLDRRGRERLLSALGQFVENKMWERVEANRERKIIHCLLLFFLIPDNQATRTHDAAIKED